MDHKITSVSPYNHAPSADEYGSSPHHQHHLVTAALLQLLEAPFESNVDLRGQEVRLTVHDDGLHVTAEIRKRHGWLR